MALPKLPSYGGLKDGQFVSVDGPNGISTGFSYDLQTRAFYFKESQVVYPSFHGLTHIAEDPIPAATCDSPGLMSSVDKCRLDTLLQTRIGVLGFQGSGFPEDGGWLNGDIILASGSGFISLERFGNVVRFTVDSPVPFNCACEANSTTSKIWWVQDETELSSLRPPTLGGSTGSGKLPNISAYGELKVYQFPELTDVNSANPAATLRTKDSYPALLFTRQASPLTPNTAALEFILKRAKNNTTEIGMTFLPPTQTTSVSQLVYHMGNDSNGSPTRFDFSVQNDPALYGGLYYKGRLITKKMAVVVDYTATVLSTNNYIMRMWDTSNNAAVGETFVATNTWMYKNPENPTTGTQPRTKVLDATIDILPIGTVVDIWSTKSGSTSTDIFFFNKKPTYNPNYSWSWVGQTQFGDMKIARKEIQQSLASLATDLSVTIPDDRNFEKNEWGLTGYDDPLTTFTAAAILGVTEGDITYQHRAVIDQDLPGLRIQSTTWDPAGSSTTAVNYSERPVYLWHRKNLSNALLRLDIGRPQTTSYIPIDIVLRGAIDQYSEKYMKIIGSGVVDGLNYIRVVGVDFTSLPQTGAVRSLPRMYGNNTVFNYERKVMFPAGYDLTAGQFGVVPGYGTEPGGGVFDEASLGNTIILVAPKDDNQPFIGGIGDIAELCHLEYNNTILRCEFWQDSNGTVFNQFKVGTLDMSRAYEDDNIGTADDLVRGMAPGYSVSAVYQQASSYSGAGAAPSTNVSGYIAYDGGYVVGGTLSEYWNRLEVMVRDDQVWVWWNKLLIPPDPTESASLPSPVAITNPYFSIPLDIYNNFGKFGVRMFPHSTLRRFDIRTQQTSMSEFAYGQLNIVQ